MTKYILPLTFFSSEILNSLFSKVRFICIDWVPGTCKGTGVQWWARLPCFLLARSLHSAPTDPWAWSAWAWIHFSHPLFEVPQCPWSVRITHRLFNNLHPICKLHSFWVGNGNIHSGVAPALGAEIFGVHFSAMMSACLSRWSPANLQMTLELHGWSSKNG